MHHSHAALTVTSLPSASYLTWGSVLETSRLASAAKRKTPSPASVVPAGLGGNPLALRSWAAPLRHDECWGGAPPDGRDHSRQRRRAVLDHENFVFVTDGIEAAVAKAELTGARTSLSMAGGWPGSLEAGLLDAVGVELVPVVLGGDAAVRRARRHAVQFEGPVAVVEGAGVTHLRYRVQSRPRPKGSRSGHPWP